MISIIYALILGFLVPGSAQIFNGQYLKGGLFVAFFLLCKSTILPLLIRAIQFKDKQKILKFIYDFNIVYVAFIIVAIIDGFVGAFKTDHSLKITLISLVLVFCVITASKQLKNKFIVYALSGRDDIFDFLYPPIKKIK
ncbi:MAG: hypothetical protein II972_00785 [Elusimicrobiaceae bacterium]|nr:hypothetical protein [Elusimicrobiaceae bacterium]